MLPRFPTEKPLALEDRPEIERMTRDYEPYSDHQFGSLWAWDVRRVVRVSTLNGNLVIRMKDYLSDEHFFTLLGDNEILETTLTLLAHAERLGISTRLRLVPEAVVHAVKRWPNCLSIAEDRSNFDYVCSIREWAILDGPGYAAHRTKVNRHRRQVAPAERRLDLTCRATQCALICLFDRWAAAKRSDDADRNDESLALCRLFAAAAAGRVDGIGLYVGGTLIAFSLWEGVPRFGYSLHHFMKADLSFPGITSYLVHRRSWHLLHAGYTLANIEQDLGIPGLAAFKQSLRPCQFLRKYTISPAARDL